MQNRNNFMKYLQTLAGYILGCLCFFSTPNGKQDSIAPSRWDNPLRIWAESDPSVPEVAGQHPCHLSVIKQIMPTYIRPPTLPAPLAFPRSLVAWAHH